VTINLLEEKNGVDPRIARWTHESSFYDMSTLMIAQGCQMVLFQTKNSNLGKFWRVLGGKMLIYLWPLGIFYGPLGYFMTIQYILCSFGNFFRFWYHVPRKIWQPCFSPCAEWELIKVYSYKHRWQIGRRSRSWKNLTSERSF
jgi:hypothetical protein